MRPPRLRTVLLLTYMLTLSAPVAGLWLMRLYESALIRQTEQELFAQAAVLAAVYRAELRHQRGEPAENASFGPGPSIGPLGLALARRSGLDLARDPVLPPPPDPIAVKPGDAALPDGGVAARAGAALSPLLAESQGVTLAALRILDQRGVIVSTTGGDDGRSVADWPEVASALGGELSSSVRSRERKARESHDGLGRDPGLRVFVAFPVLQEDRTVGAVLVSRTPRTLGQAIWGKRAALGAITSLLLAAAAGLALAASRLIARPIQHVVTQAQRVARGEADRVVPPARPGTREVADLAAAIARMAATQAERADYLRRFAASVSHEFKTPLAAIGGAAELLQDHHATMSPAERERFVAAIAGGAARLDLLVGRMLELARADLSASSGASPLLPVIERVAARFAQGGLKLTITSPAAPALRVAARAETVEMMLAGLLDNVLVHAGPGACAEIAVASSPRQVSLTVSDDGPGISPQNAPRVFETFFTTSRDRGGTGLGLAIVAALARGADGSVALLRTERGAAFGLTLPLA